MRSMSPDTRQATNSFLKLWLGAGCVLQAQSQVLARHLHLFPYTPHICQFQHAGYHLILDYNPALNISTQAIQKSIKERKTSQRSAVARMAISSV